MTLSDEQLMLKNEARRFLAQELPSGRLRETVESGDGFDRHLWRGIAAQGWLAMHIPEHHGGAGFSFVETAILCEELGRVLAPIPFLATKVMAAELLLRSGESEERERLLGRIAAGEAVAVPATAGAGGQWETDLDVTAAAGDGGFRLDGSALFVPFGHVAHVAIVNARLDGEPALFLVDPAGDGIIVREQPTLDLTRPLAGLEFDGTAAVLLERNAGPAVEAAHLAGKAALAAELVGLTERVLEMAVGYAKERKQFGRAIGSFQAVKHACADILVELEGARSLTYYATRALAAGATDAREVVLAAKVASSQAAFRAAAANIQIHGGIGFTWEHDAHYYFKRAKAGSLYLGSPERDRAVLAETLKL